MKFVKLQKNTVLKTIQKVENVTHMYIKRRFINVWAKNIMQPILWKRRNAQIVKIYYLNIQVIVNNFFNKIILVNKY